MHNKRLYFGLAFLLIVFIFGSFFTIDILKPGNPVRAASPGDWTTYLFNPGHSDFNAAETAINPNTAGSLKQLWSISEGSIISTQPVVANGLIYWGSWDGIEHATNLNGTQAWTANLGIGPSNCPDADLPPGEGVLSTATIAPVTINGTTTVVDFVGSATDTFYALNASTGATIWHVSLGTPPDQVLWASPTLYNGSIYIGLASNDCPLIQGKVFQINASTGVIQNTFNTAPNGCTGSGVSGSVAVDTTNGTLYFATGNGNTCPQNEIYGYAVIELNASNLSYISSWQVPAAQQTGDSDFISSPTIFPVTIGGTLHHMVGVANKNGIYYAFDEASIAKGPVWEIQVAQDKNDCPQCGDGSISPNAWDGTNLYVAGGNTTINGNFCLGSLRALNPATGAVIWAQCLPDGPVLGATVAVPGVVAVTEGTSLCLMATSDGHILFKASDNSNGSQYYAAPTIANGVVYAANKDGNFFAYGLGSNPTPTPTPTLPPVSGPVSKVWYFAEGRAGAGFKEFLTMGNPTGNNCQVNITYLTQPDGGPNGTKTVSVSVPAFRRVTEWVDGDLGTSPTGPGISDAATVTVDTAATPNCSGIVAERPMYFNALGTNSGSDVVGVTHAGTTFYFADLATGSQAGGGSSSSFLPILNPGAAPAVVTATYYAGGAQVGIQTLTVAAKSRGTIFPSQASPSLPSHVSVVLTSTQPVVSERPTYFSGINGGNAGIVSGGADVIGVHQLASDWLFAEGYTGGHFQENFVLANLDPARTAATVTITLEYTDGTSRAFQVTVNPFSQVIWNVNTNGTGGTSQSVSAEITSSGAKIAVEREMFFGYNHAGDGRTTLATGGTDVLGQVGPAALSDYSFAEGYTNLGYDEWLTIMNPTNNTEAINITVSNAVGTVYTFTQEVLGHSRYTVDMVAIVNQNMFHSGDGYSGYEISMAVQSSNGPFVVERPMYWNASGTQGGSDVIGYTGN